MNASFTMLGRAPFGVRALFFCLLGFASSLAADNLALVGATAIPATGGDPIHNSVVLIEEGVIREIGPVSRITIPDGFERLDVSGKWLTPGIIDANVHLILMTVPEFFIKYEDRLVDIAIQSAQVGLKYGLTTMPDTWGPLKPLLEARDRINSGEFVGARVLVAGNIIGTGGPFSAYFMGGWDPRGLSVRYGGWVHPAIQQRIDALWEDSVGPSMLAMTAEEAAQTMRDYIAKGVDFVKVGVSGHSLGPVEPLMFSPEVLKAICDEVHKAGLPLATHTFTVESLRLAIDNKPDLLVHPNVMSVPWQAASDAQKTAIRQQIKRAADAGIYAALMAVPVKLQLETYREWDALNYEGDFWVNQIMNGRRPFMGGTDYETAVAGLREWIASDVKLTFGTDAGPDSADLGPVVWGRLGRMHFSRMVGLQDAGMTPMDIIIASTRHPAEAYHLDDELGTLEAGKVADLLVLDRDPLADIANMNSINRVIKGGVIVDRDTLPTIKVLDYDPEKEWPE